MVWGSGIFGSGWGPWPVFMNCNFYDLPLVFLWWFNEKGLWCLNSFGWNFGECSPGGTNSFGLSCGACTFVGRFDGNFLDMTYFLSMVHGLRPWYCVALKGFYLRFCHLLAVAVLPEGRIGCCCVGLRWCLLWIGSDLWWLGRYLD